MKKEINREEVATPEQATTMMSNVKESKFRMSDILVLGNGDITKVVGFVPPMDALESATTA